MKTWKQGIFGILAIIAITFVFIACDDGKDTHTHEWEWVVTDYASYNTNGLETETCKTCGATNGTRPIAYPTPTEFANIALFETYTATIKDERSTCTSQNLDQLGIVTMIQQKILGAFNTNTIPPVRFRNVFGDVLELGKGVTIIVNNPATPYKVKATDNRTLYFHIDYLQGSPADIQQIISDAVNAMNGNSTLPYNAE